MYVNLAAGVTAAAGFWGYMGGVAELVAAAVALGFLIAIVLWALDGR